MVRDDSLASTCGSDPYFARPVPYTREGMSWKRAVARFFARFFEGIAAQRNREAKRIVDYYRQDCWSDSLERRIFDDQHM
jgi:hypothetical protein